MTCKWDGMLGHRKRDEEWHEKTCVSWMHSFGILILALSLAPVVRSNGIKTKVRADIQRISARIVLMQKKWNLTTMSIWCGVRRF